MKPRAGVAQVSAKVAEQLIEQFALQRGLATGQRVEFGERHLDHLAILERDRITFDDLKLRPEVSDARLERRG